MVGSILALSVKPCRACQLSQGESPWHSGIVSGSSAEFVVSPEPLPLGELAWERLRGLQIGYHLLPHLYIQKVVFGRIDTQSLTNGVIFCILSLSALAQFSYCVSGC